MASVYKPTGRNIWRVEFKDQHGKTKTISSGTEDKRIAESIGMKLEEDADRIRAGMAPKHLEVRVVTPSTFRRNPWFGKLLGYGRLEGGCHAGA